MVFPTFAGRTTCLSLRLFFVCEEIVRHYIAVQHCFRFFFSMDNTLTNLWNHLLFSCCVFGFLLHFPSFVRILLSKNSYCRICFFFLCPRYITYPYPQQPSILLRPFSYCSHCFRFLCSFFFALLSLIFQSPLRLVVSFSLRVTCLYELVLYRL